MSNATVIDEKVLTECLNEISRALMSADVQFKMIGTMQSNIKKTVNLTDLAASHNKRKLIQQAQERLQYVQSTHITIKRRDGSPCWFVLIRFELVHLISSSRMQRRLEFLSMAATR